MVSMAWAQEMTDASSVEQPDIWCGVTLWGFLALVGQGFTYRELELSPKEGEVGKMDCSFRHTCTKQPHPRPIVGAQVRGHMITAIVDTGCIQTMVHATALPA